MRNGEVSFAEGDPRRAFCMVTAERARELLARHGNVQAQPPGDWTGAFPLPALVEQFYQEVGPADVTIASHGNPFFLPRLSGLWQFQAGYRWNALNGVPIKDWHDDWLVIAGEGGDPFIFSRTTGRILFDEHGRGIWEPEELFADLNTMAACLARLGDVVQSAGASFTDENDRIRREHRERALAGLREFIASTADAEFVLAELGWG